MSNEYKPTYVDNTDNSISIMESTDTISFCKTGTKINTLSAKNVAHKKTGEDLNLCAYDGSSFNPVITINNNHSDCRIMTNLNISGNLNITNPLSLSSGGTGIGTVAKGDIFYASDTNTLTKLPAGSPGSFLTINSNNIPFWNTPYKNFSSTAFNEEWIVGGYNGTGESSWFYETHGTTYSPFSDENNKSWHLFTQWTENPVQSSTFDESTPNQYTPSSVNRIYKHYNYDINGLELNFSPDGFPLSSSVLTNCLENVDIAWRGETHDDNAWAELEDFPYSFITKGVAKQGGTTLGYSFTNPYNYGKYILFNFNKFMYLTSYETCTYIQGMRRFVSLYYLDEDSQNLVLIHEYAKYFGSSNQTKIITNGPNFIKTPAEANVDANANLTRNPLVDLTQPTGYIDGSDFSKVTVQSKPARTYVLFYKNNVDTASSNAFYYGLMKGKIIY